MHPFIDLSYSLIFIN